MRAIKGKKKI